MYYPSLVQDEQQERNGEALTLEMILSLATFNHNAAHLGSTSNNQTTLFSPYPGNTVPSLETLSFVQTTTTCIDNLRMSEQVVELKELDEFTQWYTWNNNEAARQQEASIEHHNLVHLVQDSLLIPQPQQQNDTPDTNEVMKVGDSTHFCTVTNHPAGPVAVRDIEQESIEPYPRNFIFKGFSYDKEKNKIKFINHCDSKEGKNDGPWSEREHQLFLIGLKRLGRGKWRDISQSYVRTRTRIQVASHAQKYFARQRMRGNNESSNTNE